RPEAAASAEGAQIRDELGKTAKEQPQELTEASSGFKFWRPGCNADINAPDKEFWVGSPILAPDANFLLGEVHCRSCGMHTDVAMWIVDKAEYLSEPDKVSSLSEAAMSPDAVALLDRYLGQVEMYRRRWIDLYASKEEMVRVNFSSARVEDGVAPLQLPAVPMQILAAARGLRHAVETHPFENPRAMLTIGHFNLSASLGEQDHPEAKSRPWALHVSVSNTINPREFCRLQQLWLPALFFTPE